MKLPLLIFAFAVLAASAEIFGPDLLVNGSFETVEEGTVPGWQWQTQGATEVTVDDQASVNGTRSLRLHGNGKGGIHLTSEPVAVTPGARYLVSVSYRQAGFGTEAEHYLGISTSCSIEWRNGDGRAVDRAALSRFPYGPSPWDLRDLFVTAPPAAATLVFNVNYGNSSPRHAGRDIAATLWVDAVQCRVYNAPETPAAAYEPATRIVEGGTQLEEIRTFFPAAERDWRSRGGQWSAVRLDDGAERGSVLAGLPGHGRGLMGHSPYFRALPPGVYRVIMRARCEPAEEPAGFLDVASRFAGTRLALSVDGQRPTDAGGFARYEGDWIQRDDGWWCLRLYTHGEREWAVDSIRVVPLVPLPDQRLATVYPGITGQLPDDLRPRNGGPTRLLVMAGIGYDRARLVDAGNLLGGSTEMVPAWVKSDRSFTVRGLPETPAEFFDFNAIVLCDIDAQGLSLAHRAWLHAYVHRGGALVLIGGQRMYERGHWQGSLLADLLPFTLGTGPADLHYEPAGLPIRLAADLPWLPESDTTADPRAYFLHPGEPLPDTRIFATAGDVPLLLGRDVGDGRVVAVMAMPFGAPAAGQSGFWEWDDWPYLLRNATWWATRRPNLR